MKLGPILVLLLVLISRAWCNSPTPTVSPTPDQSVASKRTRTFGSSLEKYRVKNQKSSQGNSKNEDEILRVKTELIVNNVFVTDEKGKLITNLKQDDFIVTDNNEPQRIEVFSFSENMASPRSIVLVFQSNSLEIPYLNKSIEAAKLLVDKLSGDDKMAVVTTDLKLRVDFTKDKSLLRETLDLLVKEAEEKKGSIEIMGWGGPEFETLLAVLSELFLVEDLSPIIIFQGNGNEIVRIKTGDDYLWNSYSSFLKARGDAEYTTRLLEYRDITETIEKSRATIFSVIPGIRILGLPKKEQLIRSRKSIEDAINLVEDFTKHRADQSQRSVIKRAFKELEIKRLSAAQTAMTDVAERSGGFASFLEMPEDAERVYSTILGAISKRYLIGYYPKPQDNGKRHTVKIEVRGHPEYVIVGRKTYLTQ